MQPTSGRSTKPRASAMKRYGPILAVVVVIAIVGAVIAIAGGGGSDDSSSGSAGGGSETSGAVIIDDSNRDSIDWGPDCNVERGQIKVPLVNAPPCVKPFTGDNGGATSTGVTGDSIKVVVYQSDPRLNPLQSATVRSAGADVDLATARETYQGYVELMSQRLETYGRTIDLEFFTGTGAPNDEVAARSDARAIAEKKPFAVLSGANQTPAWSEELAANKIMCVGNCSLAVPQATVAAQEPYLWGVGPTPEQAGLLTARLVTNLLAGKKAEFAGSDDLREKTRVFGVAHYDTVDGQQRVAFQTLKRALARGGVEIAADLPFQLDLARAQENARTMIAKLKDAGVTSVIYTGDPFTPAALTKEATAQSYFPEWIIGSNVLVDIAVFGRTYDQQQWRNAMGLSLQVARTNQEASQAYNLYVWGKGEPPPNNTYGVILLDLAPLFLGIQTAGPDLTPQTFKDGLFKAPVSGGTPLAATTSRGDHGLWPGTDWGGSDDTALLWWNPDAEGEDEIGQVAKGLYEYTAMGKRWTLAKMPRKDPGFFDAQRSITIFETIPPQIAPPEYPPLVQ